MFGFHRDTLGGSRNVVGVIVNMEADITHWTVLHSPTQTTSVCNGFNLQYIGWKQDDAVMLNVGPDKSRFTIQWSTFDEIAHISVCSSFVTALVILNTIKSKRVMYSVWLRMQYIPLPVIAYITVVVFLHKIRKKNIRHLRAYIYRMWMLYRVLFHPLLYTL